jgi:glutaminyl-tRNA synthetase
MSEKNEVTEVSNFIKNIIKEDNETGKFGGRVHTRFPPEPNGYLHIGHAKSICLNFGIAEEFGGKCNLRFDDTNPLKEDADYVEAIKEDVRWLGFDWEDRLYFASDYFDKFYEYAVQLIKQGDAYVCHLTPEQVREYRGTFTTPGKNSPYRNRSVEENLEHFEKMKNGEYKDGEAILRAKIDMSSPNLNMRDPAIYRVFHATHHRTGDKWCIYPMYDFAHGLEDSIERITHSLCTLEFEDHRPLYDWFLDKLGVYHPQQIEFARLNLSNTVTSKRKLLKLVESGVVSGWDDPRMPTIRGFRRRGYTPQSIRDFSDRIGVAKSNSIVDFALLEHCLREDLNKNAQRAMVIEKPLKVIITNLKEDEVIWLDAKNNQEDESAGTRKIPFTKELYVEQTDFLEVPFKKYHRLAPGKEVRFVHAFYITCNDYIKDGDGNIIELHCTYDPDTKGGWSDDGRKVKGTIHWVSAKYAVDIEVRQYDSLLLPEEEQDKDKDILENLNPDSLKIITAKAEPMLADIEPEKHFQFLRLGYYVSDKDYTKEKPVFNRAVALKDNFNKKKK